MFDLVNQDASYRRGHSGEPLELTNSRIFGMASNYISGDSRNRLQQYVEQGGSILVPENALGPGVQSGVEQGFKFDLGFDPTSM
jgi:hypothetical protein